MSRRALQVVLTLLGLTASAAGARAIHRGADEVPDPGDPTPDLDSEYRFYAAWYALAGFVLLPSARRPEQATVPVRLFSLGLWLSAAARVLSIRRLGPPHRTQQALLAAEVAIPLVLVPWQRRVAHPHS